MNGVVEVFADVRCPFTHAGLRRLVARRTELGREEPRLWLRAWPLELVNGAPLDAKLVIEEATALREQVAPELFAGLTESSFGSTSLPALALANAAYRVSIATGEAVSLTLRNSAFEAGRDVSTVEVLAEIADRYDVPPVTEDDHEQIRRDWREGQQRHVIGSPHFFVGRQDYFCPSLDIHHEADHFELHFDEPALADFFAAVFDR